MIREVDLEEIIAWHKDTNGERAKSARNTIHKILKNAKEGDIVIIPRWVLKAVFHLLNSKL